MFHSSSLKFTPQPLFNRSSNLVSRKKTVDSCYILFMVTFKSCTSVGLVFFFIESSGWKRSLTLLCLGYTEQQRLTPLIHPVMWCGISYKEQNSTVIILI